MQVPAKGLMMHLADTSEVTLACSDSTAAYLMRMLQILFANLGRLEEASDNFLSIQRKRVPGDLSHVPDDAGGGGVPKAKQETQVMKLTERMRYFPIKGWSHGMLPTDPAKWETEDGRHFGKLDEVQPPPGWAWTSPWTLTPGGDKENWMYAVDWPQKFHEKKQMMDYVRTRVHVRTAKNVSDRSGDNGSSFVMARTTYRRSTTENAASEA